MYKHNRVKFIFIPPKGGFFKRMQKNFQIVLTNDDKKFWNEQ